MSEYKVCPVCMSGHLIPNFYSSTSSYKNVTFTIDSFEHSICSTCNTSLADSEQSKRNKTLVIDFRRTVDGLLTTNEVLKIRKKLKLNQKDASKIIGGGGIAFAKYESGRINQSVAVDSLLRLLDDKPELLATLKEYKSTRELATKITTEIFLQVTPHTAPCSATGEHRPRAPFSAFFEKVAEVSEAALSFCGISQVAQLPQRSEKNRALIFGDLY
ncbi:type II toxin-antitoxin system MqsA family antitoxin [Pseudomonas sp. SCB32]|uniref:type II toxin-antitoxin system MqsA family antitoxin n=1 Tax=Pseudomonas sp. SCB32 TaxID=2653853 RepID=UPI0012652E9A|nr:type II toxin-antitoxin system MqsA family antitoxin [Pseudomonas sp. SCB32]